MIRHRRSEERGHVDHGWLDTRHTFSFAGYQDPEHMGFRRLRVLNQDLVAPGQGFGSHPHQDMEIITCVLEGALEHRDSLGNGSVIRPGDVQRMSAGTGVVHSEFNASQTEPVHFLQIWIFPDRKGIPPSYEQKHFAEEELVDRLRLIVSEDGAEGSLTMNSRSKVYLCRLRSGTTIEYSNPPDRHVWLHLATGSLTLNDSDHLNAGDAIAITGEENVRITGEEEGVVMVFEME